MKVRPKFNGMPKSQTEKLKADLMEELQPTIKELAKQEYIKTQREFCRDFDATLLWVLYSKYDWDEEKLKELFVTFKESIKQLEDFYLMPNEGGWLAATRLRDTLGINIDEWENEDERTDS